MLRNCAFCRFTTFNGEEFREHINSHLLPREYVINNDNVAGNVDEATQASDSNYANHEANDDVVVDDGNDHIVPEEKVTVKPDTYQYEEDRWSNEANDDDVPDSPFWRIRDGPSSLVCKYLLINNNLNINCDRLMINVNIAVPQYNHPLNFDPNIFDMLREVPRPPDTDHTYGDINLPEDSHDFYY